MLPLCCHGDVTDVTNVKANHGNNETIATLFDVKQNGFIVTGNYAKWVKSPQNVIKVITFQFRNIWLFKRVLKQNN